MINFATYLSNYLWTFTNKKLIIYENNHFVIEGHLADIFLNLEKDYYYYYVEKVNKKDNKIIIFLVS